MPAAIPVVAAEAALAVGAEAAAIAAAEAAALQAAQVAAAEAAAAAAAETAATTAATNLATNQSILGAIGAGGGAPASAALGGAGSGLGATSAYTGATSALTGTPAYGMPAGLEQIANPAVTAAPPAYGMPAGTEGLLPGNAPGFNPMSQAELAQIQSNIPQAGPRVDLAGTMDAVNPEMLNQAAPQGIDQVAQGSSSYTSSAAPTTNLTPEVATNASSYTGGVGDAPSGPLVTPPSTLENAFTKAMDWVKDNKMTTLSMGMNAAKLFGKEKGGGSDDSKYSSVLSKYKLSPDFQGRQADPADYQYTPKVYNMAQGGIAQIGGPIEQMSNANAVGANTGYPMADINKGAYATPYQTPISRNVISDSADTGVNPMTGEMRFAEGGIASYRDGGKAAMDYYERMTKPKEGFSGKSDPGSRYAGEVMFDTDPDTRSLDPVTAAIIRQAKVNKRANMQLPGVKRPTPMGQINMVPVTMKKGDESPNTVDAAQGGIMSLGGYAAGGNPRLLKGPGDGMSDNIPATISGKQPARLADGEFVIPADVVSHLGNGSTEAGAKKLHRMMTQVRKARTGNPKQGKQINPNKYMPK